ncbi:MAG: ABC transporter substrate-binding protein [Candidatus Limnocylindria bacterium]
MRTIALSLVALLTLAACGPFAPGGQPAAEGRIRVALGDIESVETLNFFIALERVRERGIDVELNELADEDLANQAVVSGQADIALGAPYAFIQELDAPVRIFCQLQKLAFFALVDRERYPDWQALDGETFTVHSRGSGTEAMARFIQDVEGIQFAEISYVPGSEVRATALLRGNVQATFIDLPNRNFVMGEAPGRFHELPLPDIDASDEALFGNIEWMQQNQEIVQVLLEEVLEVWRSIVEDPSFVVEERERLGLLADLPAELEEELLPYYEISAETGIFTTDCGGADAARDDFAFYTAAGSLSGEPEDLRVEDFWYLAPLERALETVGSGN